MSSASLPSVNEIAQSIDHAILKPQFSLEDVKDNLDLARKFKVFSVCVRPSDVAYASDYLEKSTVKVGTVIGFPHGAIPTAVKVVETRTAMADGADEIDMVVNIGWVKSGMFKEVEEDIRQVVAEANRLQKTIVKVILETAYLTTSEIVATCVAAEKAGANFVKTSTGFASTGATIPNLEKMREAVSSNIEVKASGGVTDLETLLAMRKIGVTRFGTSAAPTILSDLKSRLETGKASTVKHSGSY